jgi:hypothetical protein
MSHEKHEGATAPQMTPMGEVTVPLVLNKTNAAEVINQLADALGVGWRTCPPDFKIDDESALHLARDRWRRDG